MTTLQNVLKAVEHSKVLTAFHLANADAFVGNYYVYERVTTERILWNEICDMCKSYGDLDNSSNVHVGIEFELKLNSSAYEVDENGICRDGDQKLVRAYVSKAGKVQKVKPGRIMKAFLIENYPNLPQSVVNWACEMFAQEWENANTYDDYELNVDDNFEDIYNSAKLLGDFHSCMNDQGFEDFYSDNVDASAAYLTDKDGMIVARCVIFNAVEGDGDTLRLAERQYAAHESFKQILVRKLIEGGYIDGYKKVGAGCQEETAFLANDGSDLEGRESLSIYVSGYPEHYPYMDSFKYAEDNEGGGFTLYNSEGGCEFVDFTMNETSGEYSENRNWDEYREDYCRGNLITVYRNGSPIDVEDSDEGLEDFRKVGIDWHHYEDCGFCEECEEFYLLDDGVYSEMIEEEFCSQICLENRLSNLSEEGEVFYSQRLDEYYRTEEEMHEDEEAESEGRFYSYLTYRYYDTKEEFEAAESEYDEGFVVDMKRQCKIRKKDAVKLYTANLEFIGYMLTSEFSCYDGLWERIYTDHDFPTFKMRAE